MGPISHANQGQKGSELIMTELQSLLFSELSYSLKYSLPLPSLLKQRIFSLLPLLHVTLTSKFVSFIQVSLFSCVAIMGCACSKPATADERRKKIRKPRPWRHPEAITRTQLNQMREEFWDTAPHYGGRNEIWDALRAAAEAELSLAQAIIDSAGVIVQNEDLTVCYDERGARYELPRYVLSEPTNLIREN